MRHDDRAWEGFDQSLPSLLSIEVDASNYGDMPRLAVISSMAGRRNAIVEKVTDAPKPSNPIIARKQTVTSVRVLRAVMNCRAIQPSCVSLPRFCWIAAPGSSGCSSLRKMRSSVDRRKSWTLISYSFF
jgi:hypothetical protein